MNWSLRVGAFLMFTVFYFTVVFRKGHFQPKKNAIDKMRSAVASSDDEDQLEARLESLLDDEIDQYNAFKDKSLLDKGRKGKSKGAHAGGEDSDEEEVSHELNKLSCIPKIFYIKFDTICVGHETKLCVFFSDSLN